MMLGRGLDLRPAGVPSDPLLNNGGATSLPPTPTTATPSSSPASSLWEDRARERAAAQHNQLRLSRGGQGPKPLAEATGSLARPHARAVPTPTSSPSPPPRPSVPRSEMGSEQPVLMELIIEDYLPPFTPNPSSLAAAKGQTPKSHAMMEVVDIKHPPHPLPSHHKSLRRAREPTLEGPHDGPRAAAPAISSSEAYYYQGRTNTTTTAASRSGGVNNGTRTTGSQRQSGASGGSGGDGGGGGTMSGGSGGGGVRDRSSFMQRMKGWKRELWDALTSVDRHVKKTAEEDHRELSDGEKKHSTVKEFKQSYMPTREAARAVLDPRYAGHCLGTDMNKLACEGLLAEAPTVLKAAVDTVPQKLEEVISLSSNLLDELIEQAKRENATGDQQQGVRLHKFLEFYKGYKERSLRTRMDRLKSRIEAEAATLIQEACSEALAKEVLQPAEQSRPTSVVGYHQFLDSSLPRVPLAAAQAIQARVSNLVGRALAEVDEIQAELLPPMPDAYASLASKLRQMVIEDEPRAKKRRTEVIDLTADDYSDKDDHRHEKEMERGGEEEEEEEEGQGGAAVIRQRRRHPSPGDETEDMEQEEQTAAAHAGPKPPLNYVRRVLTLTELCIGMCVEYVEYLPDIPDGCFPEDLLQRMFTLLIERDALSDATLHRLLSSSMTGLNLHGWKHLSPASCTLIAHRSLALRRLDLSGCLGLQDEGLAAVLGAAGAGLEWLSVEGCVGLTDSCMASLSMCPNLLSLDASSCSRITDAGLRDLPLRCPRLAALNLRRCPLVTDEGLSQVGRWSDLALLDLWENVRLTDRVLVGASSCTQLETLRVCGRAFSDAGVRSLAAGCRGLKFVDMAGTSMSDVSVHALASSCPKLVRLSIPHSSRITDAAFSLLPEGIRLGEIEEIDVSRASTLGDESLRAIAMRCPRLHRLSLAGCEQITDAGLVVLASRCRLLTHVSVAQCKKVTDRSVCALIRASNGRLRALSLENCHQTTDATLFALAETNSTDLVDLDLSGCDAVTDEGLRAVAGTCATLEGLSVEELTELTEEGISLLGRLHCLKRLRVGYSKGLTDAALSTIALGCGELRSLDLSYCNSPRLTEAGIEAAIGRLKNLEALSLRGAPAGASARIVHAQLASLNLSWCKTLQDDALERLAEGCPSLRHLDVAWCDQITGAAVHRLAQRLASLRTFNLRGCHKIPSLTIQFLTHAGKSVQR